MMLRQIQITNHKAQNSNEFLNLKFGILSFIWILNFGFCASNVSAALDFGFAEQDGGHAGAFLEFAGSARTQGMGGAATAVSDDASAVVSNPAGLAQLSRKDIVTSYSTLFEDTTFGVFNYAQPTIDWGTFGIGFVSLQSVDFNRRDAAGFEGGTFGSAELAALLSHGIEVNDRLSLGSTFKVIREEVDAYSATGYGLDGGLLYHVTPTFNMGLNVRNVLAPTLKLRNEADKYPLNVRLGTRWQMLKRFMLAVDLDKTAQRSVKVHAGGEWTPNNLLALRAGITETEVTMGLGFRFNDWGVDYAFGYQDAVGGLEDLGVSHRIGLHINFGKKVFEQESSVRWQKKGQSSLAELRDHMDTPAETYAQGEGQKVIAETRQVIRRQGFLKASDLYAAQGYISYFEGEYERSVQSLGESLALDPQNAQLAQHLNKVRAQMTEERTHEIVKFELKRIKELYEKGDWRGTEKSCEKVLSFVPNDVEATTYLHDARARIAEPIQREMKIAKAKYERGEYLDAIKSYQHVRELDPNNKDAAHQIKLAISALEKQATAESTLTPSNKLVEIERNIEKSREYYSKGLVLYSQGNLKEAVRDWERAVQFDSQNALARSAYNRAQVELKEKP